jgi:hypothetical protein
LSICAAATERPGEPPDSVKAEAGLNESASKVAPASAAIEWLARLLEDIAYPPTGPPPQSKHRRHEPHMKDARQHSRRRSPASGNLTLFRRKRDRFVQARL